MNCSSNLRHECREEAFIKIKKKEKERGLGGDNKDASTEETLKWIIIKLICCS